LDSTLADGGKLALSACRVDQGGALRNTLQQLYGPADDSLGWFFYNDENPITGKVNGSRGHTKGALAFDLASNTAFWLIQSTPKFPPKGQYAFPKTGLKEAQTMLCITLQDTDTALSIAKQMYVAQQPNVYLASAVPGALAGQPNDARVKLINDQVAQGSTPVHVVIPFRSRGGTKFTAMAKNKTWGLDFYNDLVGPTLSENLDVETWENDPVPPPADSDKQHTVVAMKAVNLAPLGVDLAWSEVFDHAKLAISAKSEKVHYVCIGDINFTIAMRKRGGGTVAFQCEPLWAGISSILEQVGLPPSARRAGKAASRKSPSGKAGPKRAAAKKPATRKAAKPARSRGAR
jgi:deoxyribonuclease-2